ncbi:MAG: hypothetical protein ACK4MS_10610 [Paracoccaceae bacterium]
MDRVTRAEAARELALNRATITRLVQKNPALLDEDDRVSIAELRELRDATVNPKLQTRGVAAPTGGLNDTRNRTESAKAQTAELDLAERLGLTLRRDEVESAIAAAGTELRQMAFQMVRDRAEQFAVISDVRDAEALLDQFVRDLLEKGANALTLAAAQPGSRSAS